MRRSKPVAALLLATMLAIGVPATFAASPAAADPRAACAEGSSRVIEYEGMLWQCMRTGFGGASWNIALGSLDDNYTVAARDHGVFGYTWVGSTIATNNGGNHLGGSQVWAVADNGGTENHPAGTLRTRAEVVRYDGSRWVHCISNSWSTNTALQANWGSTVHMGAAPDCGAGTYSTIGVSEKNLFGSWFGAFNQSGGIYMTSSVWPGGAAADGG